MLARHVQELACAVSYGMCDLKLARGGSSLSRRGSFILFAASPALLLGFGLRAYRLGYQSLWWDETYSLDVARHGPRAILSQPRADPLPHFLALWAWMKASGQSEYAARYLSLLLGMLAMPLLYQLVRQFAARRTALAAMGLLAVSGLGVYYSQEARLHMLGLVLVLGAAYALMLAIRTNRRGAWTVYGLIAVAALYSHYYAALALLGLNLPLLCRDKVRQHAGWWLANGVAVAAFLPWAAVAYGRFGGSMAGQTTGNPAPGLGQYIADSAVFMLFGRTADWRISIGPAAAGMALLVVACGIAWRRCGPQGRMLAGYALLPVAGSYALALALPGTYDIRYAVLALPAWLALLAIGGSVALERWPRASKIGLAGCGLLFAMPTGWSLARNYAEPDVARDDYRAAFSLVRQQALPNDVLVYESPVQVTALDYYFGDAPIATTSVPLDAGPVAVADQLAQLQAEHQGIWLLLALDQRHMVEQWLDSFAIPVSNQWFGGGLRLKHYLPAPRPLAEATLKDAHAVHATFGPLRLEQVVIPAELPAGSLPIELLWTASQAPSADLVVSVQLFGPDGSRVAQLDKQPLQGALPTARWQPGEGYVDDLRLPLPMGERGSGVYRLGVSVYGPGQQPVAPLTTIATLAANDGWKDLPVHATSDAGWSIDAVRVGRNSAGNVIVHEDSSVQRMPLANYTWFAHLLDAQGQLVAQDDHPPVAATSTWQAGESASVDFALSAPSIPGATLELGAYSGSGQRVTFTLPDGSARDALVASLD